MKTTALKQPAILRPFAIPPRSAIEFSVVFAALVTADPTRTSIVIGALLAIAGVLARVWTAGYGYNLDELTVKGPYRFVRHPYLFGSALLFLGICLASRQVFVTIFAVFALLLVYRIDVKRDEMRLARSLGPRFQSFRDRVPAFIPALLPEMGLPSDGHSFSLGLSLFRGRHRELNTVLWVTAVFGLLFLCSQFPDRIWFHAAAFGGGILVVAGRLWFARSRRKMGLI